MNLITLMIFHIKVPIYNQEIVVVIGDYTEWSEYLKHNYDYDLTIRKQDALTVNILGREIIFLPHKFTTSLLVHEIGHVVLDMVETFQLDLLDQEAICYLQEYIFTQLCNTLSIPMEVINRP